MMHQYGYGCGYDMGRGTGIQHVLKNLGYNTLDMQQILLYFFPPSPVSDWYSLYLRHILHVSKPYQYKKKNHFFRLILSGYGCTRIYIRYISDTGTMEKMPYQCIRAD